MQDLDYKTNPNFSDIGDLPTGFFVYPDLKPIFIRPFTIAELNLIHRGRGTGRLEHIVRAVDLVINQDVNLLTDGDFEFIMAWLRVHSFPEVPLLVRWKCSKINILHKDNKAYYKGKETSPVRLALKGYVHEVCENDNTEIVYKHKTTLTSLEDDFETLGFETDLDVDFPRVSTLVDFYKLKEDNPELAEIAKYARWLKSGSSLAEKIETFYSLPADSFSELKRVSEKYFHGIKETINLRCNLCENTEVHTTGVDHLTFFADNSQTSIMNMKYKIMTSFKVDITDNTPSKEFLYHYSSLLKDEQEETARRNFNPNRRR